MAKLIVVQGEKKRVFNLTRDVTTIGRSKEAHVPIRDGRASRRHAAVVRVGDEYEIRDEGSQNGTVVNGRFVERRTLRPGDLIQIGSTNIFLDRVDQEKLDSSGKARILSDTETDAAHQTMELPIIGDVTDDDPVAQRENLKRLQRVLTAMTSTLDLEKMLGIIVDHAIDLTEAERGFIILAEGGDLAFEVARNFAKEQVTEPEFSVSRTIAESVLESGEPVLAVNASDDTRFKEIHSISVMGLRSVLCLPFSSRGKTVGALYIDNRLQKGVFSRSHLRMLEALGAQASIAIEHARMFQQTEQQRQELLVANSRIEKLNRALRAKVEKQQIELSRVRDELVNKQTELEHRFDYGNIVGGSPAMESVFKRLDRIIPTEMPVLIEGESGTGKELVARAIHYMGPRKKGKFVSENCAALPESLLESELFGYKKGAFTGADRDKKGLFEEATGGTFFLDEVGEMSPEMQKKMLRVLQEHEIRPIGGKEMRHVDARIISASKENLRRLVDEGRFREDLYFRLRVLSVELPPLHERKGDIPILISHFFETYATKGEKVPQRVEPAVMDALQDYHWPGNVRELENEVRRLIALSDQVVLLDSVSSAIRAPSRPDEEYADGDDLRPMEDQVRDLEVRLIRKALALTDGNKTRAAELLGVSRFTLQRKLDKYGDLIDG